MNTSLPEGSNLATVIAELQSKDIHKSSFITMSITEITEYDLHRRYPPQVL